MGVGGISGGIRTYAHWNNNHKGSDRQLSTKRRRIHHWLSRSESTVLVWHISFETFGRPRAAPLVQDRERLEPDAYASELSPTS